MDNAVTPGSDIHTQSANGPNPAPTQPPDIVAPDPSEAPIWATKGVQFWAVLATLLVRAQPDSILELGGGRSTTFLADYAARYRKRCVSIEQSDVWYRKILADLAFMRVEGTHVHHVPLVRYPGDVSWYDLDEVRRLVDGRAFDMVFLDGPQGGARRSVFGQEVVRHAAREARLIVVDDVHRDYNMAVFDELAGRTPRNGRFFLRYGGNLLAMATTEWRPIVRSTLVMTGFPILHEPPAIAKPGASHDD